MRGPATGGYRSGGAPQLKGLPKISRAEVAEWVKTALQGEPVSQVLDGQKRFDLVVKMQEPHRTDYARLKDLRIDLPEGRGQSPGIAATPGMSGTTTCR